MFWSVPLLIALVVYAGSSQAPTSVAPVSVVEQVPTPVASPSASFSELKPAEPLVIGRTSATPRWDTVDGYFIVANTDVYVPVGTMAATGGVVNPPTTDKAYLIEGYGTPRGHGTSYVALHSGRGIDAAGNGLFDIATGAPTVKAGGLIVVDAVYYTITDVRLIKKSEVVKDPEIWKPKDGRLVVFTCLQRPTGKSIDNVVIIAQRNDS